MRLGRAAAVVAGLASVACARATETRETTVLSVRPRRLETAREPWRDRVAVRIAVEGKDVRVAVERENGCATPVAEERRVRERHVVSSGGRAGTYGTLLVTGTALTAGAFLLGSLEPRKSPQQVDPEPFDVLILWPMAMAGMALVAGAGIGLGVDASRESDETTFQTSVGPPVRVDRSPCPASPPAGSVVEIVPPGWPSMGARLDARGQAVVSIPEVVWAANGGEIDADVLVDGKIVRRATLRRPSP